jgi:hypothetical protein
MGCGDVARLEAAVDVEEGWFVDRDEVARPEWE